MILKTSVFHVVGLKGKMVRAHREVEAQPEAMEKGKRGHLFAGLWVQPLTDALPRRFTKEEMALYGAGYFSRVTVHPLDGYY